MVCVDDSGQEGYGPGEERVHAGRTYTVAATRTCGCGGAMVDVGLPSTSGLTCCTVCHVDIPGRWHWARRFVPPQRDALMAELDSMEAEPAVELELEEA